MKFSTIDEKIQNESGNVLDLIYFDEIKENTFMKGYPAFIIRGDYIKTITQIPGVDFFNLSVDEQEDKVKYFASFLSSLKSPAQIFVHSKPIDTEKYLNEVTSQVLNSPYINENLKKEIIRGLPLTLNYIKQDGSSTPYKKEYFLITSCKIGFNGDVIQEDKENIIGTGEYSVGNVKNINDTTWTVFQQNFTRYYQQIVGPLSAILEDNKQVKPLRNEEQIIGLFAELNNQIDRNSIKKIKNML